MPAAPTATSADVAAVVPERVLDPGGDFTPATEPTKVRVDQLIAQIVVEVQAVVGPLIPDALAAYATLVVATGAASLVELGLTNAGYRDAATKYEFLRDLYRGDDPEKVGGMLKILDDSVRAANEGDTLGEDPVGFPVATMPPAVDVAGRAPAGGYTTISGTW